MNFECTEYTSNLNRVSMPNCIKLQTALYQDVTVKTTWDITAYKPVGLLKGNNWVTEIKKIFFNEWSHFSYFLMEINFTTAISVFGL